MNLLSGAEILVPELYIERMAILAGPIHLSAIERCP